MCIKGGCINLLWWKKIDAEDGSVRLLRGIEEGTGFTDETDILFEVNLLGFVVGSSWYF